MQPKICTKWLHTLTWLNDVWSGVTPSTSPIPRSRSVSPSCTKANTHTHTHRFPFPEPCFENRRFILTVNSQADRYSLTILSTIKPSPRISAPYTCYCGSVSQRWSVANHHKHEECGMTCGRRIRWHDVELNAHFGYSGWWKQYYWKKKKRPHYKQQHVLPRSEIITDRSSYYNVDAAGCTSCILHCHIHLFWYFAILIFLCNSQATCDKGLLHHFKGSHTGHIH